MEDRTIEEQVASRKGSNKWIVYVFLIAIFVAVAGYVVNEGVDIPLLSGQSSGPPSGVGPNVGMLAPDFTLKDPQGNQVSLSGFRGRPVMINFWATWCPPCRYEMPFMETVYRERAADGLVILAVSIDEDPNEVPRFMKEFGITFPVVLDTDQSVATKYRIRPIPTSFFVDKDGVIRDMEIGAMDKKTILKKLSKVMP
ncbi:MAG: TlpA disulfide reductase family protein [Dehalococcoidales bacterium]|nr:TlpA disulfide reductase family protein [Dehalococcoidales bacterium]